MDFTKFKSLLDEQMNWPDYYQFKFVAKTDEKHKVINILSDCEISERVSKNGTYTSITGKKLLNSSDEVVSIYHEVSKIKGIVTL